MITKKQLVLSLINILLIIVVIFFSMFKVSNIATTTKNVIIIIGLLSSTILILLNHLNFSKLIKDITEIISFIFISVSIIMIIMTYFIFSSIVKGSSMEPTLTNNQRLYISVFNYHVKTDDVIIYNEESINDYIVKRVVAVKGDRLTIKESLIENTNIVKYYLVINDVVYQNSSNEYYSLSKNDRLFKLIGEDSYLLKNDEFIALGDNEQHSADSRTFGIFNVNKIVGKVIGY